MPQQKNVVTGALVFEVFPRDAMLAVQIRVICCRDVLARTRSRHKYGFLWQHFVLVPDRDLDFSSCIS